MQITIGDRTVEVRPINISDYAEIRLEIRRERLKVFGNMGGREDVMAKAVAAPVTTDEVADYVRSYVGWKMLLLRCSDNKLSGDEIQKLIDSNDEQISLWFGCTSVPNQPTPADSK